MKEMNLKPFVWTSLMYAFVGATIAALLPGRGFSVHQAVAWMVTFWALSSFDLWALAQTAQGFLSFAAGTVENKPALLIHTLFWGMIKLACLGTFILVLIKGGPFPTSGLLAGMGTLVVVPLTGGMIWSRKVLHHA